MCEPQNTRLAISSNLLFVDELKHEGQAVRLKNLLLIKSRQLDDLSWEVVVPELGIYTIGISPKEAMQEVEDEFSALIDGLLGEPDDNLTCDAQQLRSRLRSLVD